MHGTQTPVGNGTALSQLDLNNKNTQFELLSYDKHQTLEGLQIEPVAITYIQHLEKLGLEVPDVATVIALQKGHNNARCFFVWDRSKNGASESRRLNKYHLVMRIPALSNIKSLYKSTLKHKKGKTCDKLTHNQPF